jgi:hypothetical protein
MPRFWWPRTNETVYRSWIVQSGANQSFGLLYPSELQILTFSFASDLQPGNLLITTQAPTFKVTNVYGNDGDPAQVLKGAATVNTQEITIATPFGSIVCAPQTAVQMNAVGSSIPGAVYLIEMRALTNNAAIAPVCKGRLMIGSP